MENNQEPKKNIPPQPSRPAKWSVVGKFLKDVGHFIFDEDKAGDEVKRDLLTMEMVRAQERASEKAAKVAAETRAKQKVEAEKIKSEVAAKAKFLAAKTKTASHFQAERAAIMKELEKKQAEILKRKQIMAEHLLKARPVAKPATVHHGFSWFKKRVKTEKIQPSTGQATSSQFSVPKPPMVNPLQPPMNGQAKVVSGQWSETKQQSEIKLEPNKEKAAKKFQEERLKHETSNQREQIENRPWQSYNMVATNLIKEQRSMFLNWQGKLLVLALFASLSILVCVLAYGFLLITEKDKLNSNDYVFKNLSSIVAEIKKEESYAQEILKFNDKLLAVDYLLKNHIYWTNFFTFLENNTITNVYYESFSGDLNGKYVLPAVAKDFRSISSQLKVFQAVPEKVVSVDSGGAAADKSPAPAEPGSPTATTTDSKVKFNLNLNLNRSLFIKLPEYE